MNNKLYPIKFKPIFKLNIWGGTNISSSVYNMEKTKIGESWEISDRNDDMSIVSNGFLKNKSFKEIKEIYQYDLLGTSANCTKPFALLVKIIDAKDNLSLQLHPKEEDLPNLPALAQPKSEFWYILDSSNDANVYVSTDVSSKNIIKHSFLSIIFA